MVTTIHQPSSRLFSRFDKLILLGKGCSLYSGKASEAMVYFSSIGCSPLIAMNPAEFLIDLANGNIKDKSFPSDVESKALPGNQDSEPSPSDVHEATSRKLLLLHSPFLQREKKKVSFLVCFALQYLVEAYESRAEDMQNRRLLNPILIEDSLEQMGATWWEQFSVLLIRGFKERRHEYFSTLRITQVIITALIAGLLWWRSDVQSPSRVADQASNTLLSTDTMKQNKTA